jgi:CheY-like chemotaxis protein
MLKLRVLVVDDSPVVREMVKDIFLPEGFDVLEAENGEEALKVAWEKHPDLIIADIKMPGIDGWELCNQIRKHPYTSFIPFIFLTEKREVSDRIKGLEMGADDYVTKPFEPGELLARARSIFNRMMKREEEKIVQSKGLHGSTQMMDLADLLQLFGINSKTGILKVTHTRGDVGRIGFVAGRITNADLGNLKGVKAIRRMLRWGEANFQVEPLLDERDDQEFQGKLQEVILGARQEEDELKHFQKKLGIGDFIERSDAASSLQGLSKLEARVLAALEEKAGAKVEEVLDLLPETDLEVYKALLSLLERNYLKK